MRVAHHFDQLKNIDESDPPVYQEPQEVGFFSLDGNRVFHHDRHQMRWYYPPRNLGSKSCPSLDLNHGYRTDLYVDNFPTQNENLEYELRWMLANKQRFIDPSHPEKLEFPQFFTRRGYLLNLMLTPFYKKDGWKFVAQKFRNVIYLNRLEHTKVKHANFSTLACYQGRKFGNYICRPFDNSNMTAKEMKSQIYNTSEAFRSVVKSKIGNDVNIMSVSTVECCKPQDSLSPPNCYVKIRTKRISSLSSFFKSKKALKWWAQSTLAGVPLITCGERDAKGYVKYISEIKVNDIPKAKKNRNESDEEACFACLHNILKNIKQALYSVNDPGTTCMVSFEPGSTQVVIDTEEQSSECFLPDWFVKEMYA